MKIQTLGKLEIKWPYVSNGKINHCLYNPVLFSEDTVR